MKVRLSDHARLDSFPLRFGFEPNDVVEFRNEKLDEFATSRQKPVEIQKGNQHYVGDIYSTDGDFLCTARLVIASKRKHELYPIVITALPIDYSLAERSVSELIRAKRESGKLDVQTIISKIFPKYIKGEVSTPESLFDYFVELGVEEKLASITAALTQAEEISQILADRSKVLEAKNEELSKQIFQAEQSKSNYKGETLDIAPSCKLRSVLVKKRKNFRGELVDCTYLTFDEADMPERKMDQIFDRNGMITRKAFSLVGKYVRTSVWKPETFSEFEWFRDIYEVKD